MPSKVKILPSDVLPLIIDYLDSPTMMNCREVCKSWLDVVDGNRSLWDYFYDTSLTDIETTASMLNLFSIKSHHSLKVFSVIQGENWKIEEPAQCGATFGDELDAEIARQFQDAKTYLDILLRSKESLKVFLYSDSFYDYFLMRRIFDDSAQFPNLKSIYFQRRGDPKPVPARIRQSQITRNLLESSSIHRPLLTRLLIQDPLYTAASHQAAVIKTHQSTLLHLQTSCGMDQTWSFPRLQALHLPSYKNKLPSSWHCPSLKLVTLTLGHGKEKTIVDYFSPSAQYLWWMNATEGWTPSIKRGGLDNLKRSFPGLEILRIDADVNFYQDEVVKVVKARKAAVKKGLEVEGSEMSSITKLIVDFSKLDSPTLSKLQELVPEVVDVRTASEEVIIDC